MIAIDLGRLVIQQLGERGFVYLAARRALFDDPPLSETLEMISMVKALNNAMATRYRMRDYDFREGLGVLRGLDLTKKCTARFAELKRRALASFDIDGVYLDRMSALHSSAQNLTSRKRPRSSPESALVNLPLRRARHC